MRIIIDGRAYDTDKAVLIGFSQKKPNNELQYIKETMYRKKNGEFFLYCEGGAESMYNSINKYGEKISGEYIIPLSFEKAQEWLHNNNINLENFNSRSNSKRKYTNSSKYKDKISVNLQFTQEVHNKLKHLQSYSRLNFSEIVSLLIMNGEQILKENKEAVHK